MRAVIADDDPVATAILSRALERWGIDAVSAPDGEAAWNLLTAGPAPALAILDWMMPGLDGIEICRRIRRTPALAGLYVLLLTGRNGRADLVAGLDAGADDYMVKPIDTEELRARVQVGIRVATLQGRLADQVTELEAARDHLSRLVSTDVLTSVYSRRWWFELASVEFSRWQRYESRFSLMVIDLDFFKRVNDTFGHGVGDEVLKQFANVLIRECRGSDIVGRLGGEEFAVLLPQTPVRAAQDVGRRILDACRRLIVQTPNGDVKFTCSIGVTEATDTDPALESVLERADTALYQAKRNGRDSIDSLSHAQTSDCVVASDLAMVSKAIQ